MGNATYTPGWWKTDRHESAWTRVKDAMHRDWEQTKADLGGRGPDLDQDVDDTVKQAAGKDVIPPDGRPNAPGGTPKASSDAKTTRRPWTDVEPSLRYGVGAREQYGKDHPAWDDKLESTLKSDWESFADKASAKWDDVKRDVRQGYERATS